jgi:hypothetical protein
MKGPISRDRAAALRGGRGGLGRSVRFQDNGGWRRGHAGCAFAPIGRDGRTGPGKTGVGCGEEGQPTYGVDGESFHGCDANASKRDGWRCAFCFIG